MSTAHCLYRSANIALLQYEDGEKRYILAPLGLTDGDVVIASASADIKPGNALPISSIPVALALAVSYFAPSMLFADTVSLSLTLPVCRRESIVPSSTVIPK